VLAAGCGGCGTAPTAADLRYFADQWFNNPHYRQTLLDDTASHIGLAMHANGEGRKIAIAVVGRSKGQALGPPMDRSGTLSVQM
jgi:hypothetical protein